MQARRGELMDALEGAALVAVDRGEPAGLLTWFVAADGATAEVRALIVEVAYRGRGIGRGLLDAAAQALRAQGVRRVWLTTTNENLAALALYQKAGYRLTALHAGAMDELRRLKPAIPAVASNGIPIRDELELSREL
jgi:ribosomal protein S18 acetylase RimI-like enzyme